MSTLNTQKTTFSVGVGIALGVAIGAACQSFIVGGILAIIFAYIPFNQQRKNLKKAEEAKAIEEANAKEDAESQNDAVLSEE